MLRDIGTLKLQNTSSSSRGFSEKETSDELKNLVDERRQNERADNETKQATDSCGNLYT